MLRAFAPRLRPGGRLIVVASALGTLDKLDPRVRPRFAAAAASLDAVDALVAEWRDAVHAGRAEQEGFGTLAEHPVEGRAGRRRPRRRSRAPGGRPRGGQAHRRALPRAHRHRRLAALVRRHEPGADARRGRRLAGRARRSASASIRPSTASSCSSARSSRGRPASPSRTGRRRRPAAAGSAPSVRSRAAARAPRAAPAARRAGGRRTGARCSLSCGSCSRSASGSTVRTSSRSSAETSSPPV